MIYYSAKYDVLGFRVGNLIRTELGYFMVYLEQNWELIGDL